MSFSKSSREIRLEDNTFLIAKCKKRDGTISQSRLNLNTYIGNRDGVFDLSDENFNGSARNVRLEGSSLHAELRTRNGKWCHDVINLDALIGNEDGKLVVRRSVDENDIRPPEWKLKTSTAEPPRENLKAKKEADPVIQCHLCEDWPYTHVWTRTPHTPRIKSADLKSSKRTAGCRTCLLAERISQELVPKVAEPKKVKANSVVLELRPQPTDFPKVQIKFDTDDGEHRELNFLMHSQQGTDLKSPCGKRITADHTC
jgi:hypothetical protein